MAKILVIEDHADIQALLHDILSPKYQVFVALDGISALQSFTDHQPDLIILDLMLPNIMGESVLKTIRKTSNVPILVLTAIQNKTKTVALLQAGADDYLTKPYDIDELSARVQVQLRNTHPTDNPNNKILSLNEIRLNVTTHEITINEQPLILPKKEFNILKILLQHPHQVFEKAQIYEMVWGGALHGCRKHTQRPSQ